MLSDQTCRPASGLNGDTNPQVFMPERSIAIPSTDLVSYAFAAYGTYDLDKPIFVDATDPSKFITARAARMTVRQLIGGLKAHGLQQGDCVCVHSYNNILYPLLWLGAIGAGGCVSGSNPAYTVPELVHHLRATQTKIIISQQSCLDTIAQAARECQIPSSQIFVLPSSTQQLPAAYLSFEALLNDGEDDWNTFNDQDEGKASQTVAVLSATSGTTGLPKSAELPHDYIVAQSEMIQTHHGHRPCGELSQLVCLPVFHAFAAQVALILPLRKGITTYFMPRFDLVKFAKAIFQFKITDTAVVPPIITALLKLPPEDQHLLRSLRYVICAGAPMNADMQTKLYTLLAPHAVVGQCWGATEVGWISLFNWEEKDTSGSVGRLLPNVKLKLLDDEGITIAKDNVHGEALIHSSSSFKSYRHDPTATATSYDSEGYFRTGDRVFVRNGRLFVDGRIKDIVKVKGWQVSPAELEAIVIQHPKVHDVAVVGVTQQNNDGLEENFPRAYVVLKPEVATRVDHVAPRTCPPQSPDLVKDHFVTEAEIKEFVASRVISYKKLTGGVKFVDKIPRNPTGKILRRLLIDQKPQNPSKPLPPIQPTSSTLGSDGTDEHDASKASLTSAENSLHEEKAAPLDQPLRPASSPAVITLEHSVFPKFDNRARGPTRSLSDSLLHLKPIFTKYPLEPAAPLFSPCRIRALSVSDLFMLVTPKTVLP